MTEPTPMPDAAFSALRELKTHGDADATVRVYLTMRHRVSLRELVTYLLEHHPAADPYGVRLNFGSAVWDEPATEAEVAARLAWQAAQRERTEAWERRKYAELKARFEGGNADVEMDEAEAIVTLAETLKAETGHAVVVEKEGDD